jgi:hypothetical protein
LNKEILRSGKIRKSDIKEKIIKFLEKYQIVKEKNLQIKHEIEQMRKDKVMESKEMR